MRCQALSRPNLSAQLIPARNSTQPAPLLSRRQNCAQLKVGVSKRARRRTKANNNARSLCCRCCRLVCLSLCLALQSPISSLLRFLACYFSLARLLAFAHLNWIGLSFRCLSALPQMRATQVCTQFHSLQNHTLKQSHQTTFNHHEQPTTINLSSSSSSSPPACGD